MIEDNSDHIFLPIAAKEKSHFLSSGTGDEGDGDDNHEDDYDDDDDDGDNETPLN